LQQEGLVLSEEMFRSVQNAGASVNEAFAKFMEASAAARQRLSDQSWADLMRIKEKHPEITIDDVIAEHNKLLEAYDAQVAPLLALKQQVDASHRALVDTVLDAENERAKE
jgi:hypothetical protein